MPEYITTYTGRHFYPTRPNPADIVIEDIAHALSFLCRGNGHVNKFWSVAEHCICCAKEAEARGLSERMILACLLHDASECYMSDVPRPLKEELASYEDYEKTLLQMIFEKFLGSDLTEEEEDQLAAIDDAMLWYDLKNLLGEMTDATPPKINIELVYNVRSFEEVEQEYLQLFSWNYDIIRGLRAEGKWFQRAVEYKQVLDNSDRLRKSHIDCWTLEDLPRNWEGIESLGLGGTDVELINELPNILDKAIDLKKLSTLQYSLKWEELCKLNLKNIEHLSVRVDKVAYFPKLDAPRLKELHLSAVEYESDEKYANHMDFTGLMKLEELTLNTPPMCLDDFASLKSLKFLRLNTVQNDDLDWLSKAEYSLKTLIVNEGICDCRGLNYQKNIEKLSFFHHEITDVSPIENLKNLRALDLGRGLLKNEGNLRSLNLEYIQITDQDVVIRNTLNEVWYVLDEAVKRFRNEKKRYEESENDKSPFKKYRYEKFRSKSYEDNIKHYVRKEYNCRIKEFDTPEWLAYMQKSCRQVLPPEEYTAFFKKKAFELYPFLAEEEEEDEMDAGSILREYMEKEWLKSRESDL